MRTRRRHYWQRPLLAGSGIERKLQNSLSVNYLPESEGFER